MTQTEENLIRLPLISKENLTNARIFTAHYRKGGVRLEFEQRKGKNIFHNYGYGFDAAILAYGSSNISSRQLPLKFQVAKVEGCAVLGGGVEALFTAIELMKAGRKVTIYSEKIYELKPKDKNERPLAMPRIWMPSEHDWSGDALKHELFSKISFDFFKESLRVSRFQGVRNIKAYDFVKSIEELREVVTDYIYDTFVEADLRFENKKKEKGVKYSTVLIDSNMYLEELRLEAFLRGAKFVQRRFNTLDDVLEIKEDFIFNCIASASGYLFGQKGLTMQRKLVMEFQPVVQPDFQLQLSRPTGKGSFEIYSLKKKIYVVAEPEHQDLKQAVEIALKKVSEFVDQHSLKPSL